MLSQSPSTVLVVGMTAPPQASSVLDVYTASTVREALATIRLVSFDLVLAGLDDSELDLWSLMQRVTTAWPHQRWILAAPQVTAEEEILARSLGALMVLNAVPSGDWIVSCAESLRSRAVAAQVRPLTLTATGPPLNHAGLFNAKAS